MRVVERIQILYTIDDAVTTAIREIDYFNHSDICP